MKWFKSANFEKIELIKFFLFTNDIKKIVYGHCWVIMRMYGTSGQVADAKEISPLGNTGQKWATVTLC